MEAKQWSRATTVLLQVLGLQAKLARRRRQWTEAETAVRARVSRSTLSKIEHGHSGVALAAVLEVCWVLGVPVLGASGLTEAEALLRETELQLAGLPARVRVKGGTVPSDEF